MPDPNTPGRGTSVNLTSAPGGDINFDDLFPIEAESLTTLAPQVQPGSDPSVAAPQPPAQDFFIRGKRSVYKTSEEAIKGLDTKDDLIDNYRSFLKTKGIDPDTFQPTPASQAQPAPSNSPYTYLDNEGKLYEDLARLSRTDPAAWGRTLRQYNQEVLSQQIAPVLPLLTEVSRQKAVRQVSQEVPEFSTFMGGDSYKDTLDKSPILKQAIESAENNFELANTLPQLYQLAYLVAQGRRTPEPVVAAPVAAPVQSHPARSTAMSPSSLTPPQPGTAPDLRTSEGRKTLIRDAEARGILDRSF